MEKRRVGLKAQRRTQAERSAATRNVLFDAAVRCLVEHGYGATTTIAVAKMAGVSRGAMLHQFPSKADLMTFVVEEDFAEEEKLYRELLAGIDDPRERTIAYPDAVWNVLSRPSGVAVMEILQGSRSDGELAAKLAPVQAKIDQRAKASLNKEFPRGVSAPLFQLVVGAARGLAISQVMRRNDDDVDEAIRLLQRLLEAGIDTGVFSDRKAVRVPAIAKSR